MLARSLFETCCLLLSFLVTVVSYLIIVWKDRSWINWATPAFITGLGGRYFFQFLYLYNSPTAGGSRYAYAYVYTTYALSALIGSLVYAFVKPLKIGRSNPSTNLTILPWLLLMSGFLLYLPILIEFRAYLANPRRIYELTRTGYGFYFYGSTTLTTLGFVTYLFRTKNKLWSSALFFSLCVALAYWHGSKGQLIIYLLVWVLYRVYVARKPIRALLAVCIGASVAGLVLGSFALYTNTEDITSLSDSVTTFADYVRNAMLVIDDSNSTRYFGRLTVENEIYARIPRSVMPDKPKDFGPFILAKTYNPASYRLDEGVGAFDIGATYADFGPWSIILICGGSALAALFVSSLVQYLRRGAGAGVFIVFLFTVGLGVIPISGPFFLPESIVLGGFITWVSNVPFSIVAIKNS